MEAYPPEKIRNAFCIRLLLELTIIGRFIWSDERISDTEKIEALKWINEINHRILGAYNNEVYSMEDLKSNICGHAGQTIILPGMVETAWQKASESITQNLS